MTKYWLDPETAKSLKLVQTPTRAVITYESPKGVIQVIGHPRSVSARPLFAALGAEFEVDDVPRGPGRQGVYNSVRERFNFSNDEYSIVIW